jgi:hypothetical protein
MIRSTRPQHPPVRPGPPISEPDDALGALLRACEIRFPAHRYSVTRDDRSTVWIRSAGGTRSVGLNLGSLRMHSLDEVLDRAESKLKACTAKRRTVDV